MSSINLYSDEYFMGQALLEAEVGYEKGEIPVGAVVVSRNRIIARAHNQTERLGDVTAHAELLAITSAANHIGAKYLTDCVLYVTLEPCVMCAGALFWAQLGRIVFGASDPKRGFDRYDKVLHPKTKISFGVFEKESNQLLKNFFSNLR